MRSVTLIDYGVGNIKAFAHIYERLNVPVSIASTSAEIKSATHLVLPGVGAFDWAMTKLNNSGMRDALDYQVLEKGTPVIGVCVGMQMMSKGSEEGKLGGLGWLDAQVVKFKPRSNQLTPLPHMGWNDVLPKKSNGIFENLKGPRFYFLHSYIVVPGDDANISAITHYGYSFACAVQRGNVYGTQFHPEKSHQWGISLLRNFVSV
jgi:imidazole glycerol-phosphate synthase subunit HisH